MCTAYLLSSQRRAHVLSSTGQPLHPLVPGGIFVLSLSSKEEKKNKWKNQDQPWIGNICAEVPHFINCNSFTCNLRHEQRGARARAGKIREWKRFPFSHQCECISRLLLSLIACVFVYVFTAWKRNLWWDTHTSVGYDYSRQLSYKYKTNIKVYDLRKTLSSHSGGGVKYLFSDM